MFLCVLFYTYIICIQSFVCALSFQVCWPVLLFVVVLGFVCFVLPCCYVVLVDVYMLLSILFQVCWYKTYQHTDVCAVSFQVCWHVFECVVQFRYANIILHVLLQFRCDDMFLGVLFQYKFADQGTRLLPKDPAQRAKVLQSVHEVDCLDCGQQQARSNCTQYSQKRFLYKNLTNA